MAIKVLKPIGNSKRGTSYLDFSLLTKSKIPRSLKEIVKKNAGRNSSGKITVAHHGGGSKRFYRKVNFSPAPGEKAKVVGIEYDPNRSANIAKVQYESGDFDYFLAPEKLKVETIVECDQQTAIKVGNRCQIKNIPVGTPVHNIELQPGLGGQICRSAGGSVAILSIDKEFVQVKLPSNEVRKINPLCFASIGSVGNADKMNISIGTAGRKRLMGVRPTVRGKAKNAVDHPHGGGEGSSPIGLTGPKTPWGVPALGYRTRNRKKKSAKLIVKRRR